MFRFSLRGLFAGLLLGVVLVPPPAASDGFVMRPIKDGWGPVNESSQQALITYHDGIERLIVAIGVGDADAKSMVWVLPVPAAPKNVHADVLSSFPAVHGTEVFSEAIDNLRAMEITAACMQIWTLPFCAASMFMMSAPTAQAPADVLVHERLEKEGVVVEVITAKEGNSLYQYLAGKGLNVTAGSVPTLESYIGKEYTFVTSWLSSDNDRKLGSKFTVTKGIDVKFPAEELFFPLLPTSGYGDRVIPLSIRVAGHVTPRLFANINQEARVNYYVAEISDTISGLLGTDLYTKIDIKAPAKLFTQDLWISPNPPSIPRPEIATIVARHPVLIYIVLLVAFSALTSVLVGWLVFRELRTRKGTLRLMLVGLGNCFTLLGIMLVTIDALPSGRSRRTGYVVAFSFLFILGMVIACESIDIPPPITREAELIQMLQPEGILPRNSDKQNNGLSGQ